MVLAVVFALSPCLLVSVPSAQCEVEVQDLEPVNGQPGEGFGYRVERSGNVAIVASTFAPDLGMDAGAATVFVRDSTLGWTLSKRLLATDGAAGDFFSYSVAVDGANVLVGAPNHDDPLADRGAVYVFSRDQGGVGNWGEVACFTPAGAGLGARSGYSMSVRGDRLLVGAPHLGQGVAGKAFLFARDARSPSGWSLEFEFTSDDLATAFQFGQDVSLGDGLLAVSGAAQDLLPRGTRLPHGGLRPAPRQERARRLLPTNAGQARCPQGDHRAHKLARLFYSMLATKRSFADIGQEAYERLYQARRLTGLERAAKQLGYQLVPAQVP